MEDCIRIRKQEDRRNGKIYIYSSVDTWDKSIHQSRSKRKLIGRLDPKTNEVICTHKWEKGEVLGKKNWNKGDVICNRKWDVGDVIGRIDSNNMFSQHSPNLLSQELSYEQCLALHLIMEDNLSISSPSGCPSLFISGSAGSGKTEVLVRSLVGLKQIRNRARILVMATTGLAADNINQTYSKYISKLREEGHEIPSERDKRVAYTIHDSLRLGAVEWFDPDVEGPGFSRNISEKEKSMILKFFREEKNNPYPTEEEISEEARNRLVHHLSRYAVIMIDEASMLSPNLLDIILKLKNLANKRRNEIIKEKKREGNKIHTGYLDPEGYEIHTEYIDPEDYGMLTEYDLIRTVFFGDFHQLPPVIKTEDKMVKENYEKHYHGGSLFFCCDGISKPGNGQPLTLFFELKENHRIGHDKKDSKKKQKTNEIFNNSLEAIKKAPNILYDCLDEKGMPRTDAVEKLKPLQDALVFFNSRYKPLSRFLQLKKNKNLRANHIFPIIICGTNKQRRGKNKIMLERYWKQEENQYELEFEIQAGKGRTDNPTGSFKFFIGLPVIFTRKHKSKIRETEGESEQPDTYMCPKGKTGIVSAFCKGENGKPVSLFVKVKINGEEKEVGPIEPGLEERKMPDGKTVKKKSMPIEPWFAMTYHKSQGQSLDAVYLLTSPKKNRLMGGNTLYVGLSRARDVFGLGISRKFPLPLDDKEERINRRNFYDLCYKYFKVSKPKSEKPDETTSLFFLRDIKKYEPSVYKNWEYFDVDKVNMNEWDYYADDDTYQKLMMEKKEAQDEYYDYIDKYGECDDNEEEYYNEGYDPDEDEDYYNEGYGPDEDEEMDD